MPLYNNPVDQQGLPKDLRKNTERYPLKDVCQDMFIFIVRIILKDLFIKGSTRYCFQLMQERAKERIVVAEIL